MKRILIALPLLALVSVSCTKKYTPDPDPQVGEQGITVVTAEVTGTLGDDVFVWDNRKMGIYDSAGHSNQRYTIKTKYVGSEGVAEFYGQGVSGDIVAYIPYYEYGYDGVSGLRQPVPAVQEFSLSALEHFKANSILVARADENHCFKFSYTAAPVGLLHFVFNADVKGRVRSFTISSPYAPLAGDVAMLEEDIKDCPVLSPSYEMDIVEVNQPCTVENPVEFYALVPAGAFRSLTVSAVTSSGETLSYPVDGEYVVEKAMETEITVVPIGNSSTTGEFEAVDGEFD